MKKICALCKTNAVDERELPSVRNITDGVCKSCSRNFNTAGGEANLKALADAIDAPVLVLQAEPRQVYTANRKALELFNKGPNRVDKHRGGQVFDCIFAFTEAGCGKDMHCGPCRIKNAIVETLTTGRPCKGVTALLDTRKNTGTRTYTLQITTEKIGDMALVRIDRYSPVT